MYAGLVTKLYHLNNINHIKIKLSGKYFTTFYV
jgi:hypothetical protein